MANQKHGKKDPGKSYGRFRSLAPGHIQPEGWLQNFARTNADGWLLRYAHMRDPEIYSLLWNRVESLQGYWDSSCDFAGYFADGLVRYSHLVPDSRLAQELDGWLKQVIASQGNDGYLGPFKPGARHIQILEAFTIAIVVEALLQHYHYTGDASLLKASERAFRYLLEHWGNGGLRTNPSMYKLHGTFVIRAATQLFEITGTSDYLNYAEDILRRFGRVKEYLRFYPEQELREQRNSQGWIAPKPDDKFTSPKHFRHEYDQTDFLGFSASSISEGYNACSGRHNVCESEDVGMPAMIYEYTGDKKLLRASEAAWEMMQTHLSPDGSPLGNELLLHRGPRASTEHCGAVEWMITNQVLTRVTGEVKYADAVERVFFNAYPAAKSPDGLFIAYLHAANQLVATEWNIPPWNDHDKGWSSHFFSTAHDPLCCNANGPRAIPHFVAGMAMRDSTGLTVMHYGPCKISADIANIGNVTLRQDTAYPFEDSVRISLEEAPQDAFLLGVRIPGWCSSAAIKINGARWRGKPVPGRIARMKRRWQKGDQVDIHFEVPIHLVSHPETALRTSGLAVQRGPLLYALSVPEHWEPYEALHAWSRGEPLSYQLVPKRRSGWNVALLIDTDNPESSFSLVRLRASKTANPWDRRNAPIGLKVKVRKVKNWQLEGDRLHPETPGMPYKPLDLSQRISTTTLLPYGSTRLRLAYLPWEDAKLTLGHS